MWIKSQNGDKLVDCYEFYIRESKINSYCYIYSKHGKLGTYKSREQAEKVLRHIENGLLGYCSKYYESPFDCSIAGTEYHGIFTMPPADECDGDNCD